MTTRRRATATWTGNLQDGEGNIQLERGKFTSTYSFHSRFEDQAGTNPEELIAAAHAACYSMALANMLDQAGLPPNSVQTTATVHLDKIEDGFEITLINLTVQAQVPAADQETFRKIAEKAKTDCPVSKALAGPRITLTATLLSSNS